MCGICLCTCGKDLHGLWPVSWPPDTNPRPFACLRPRPGGLDAWRTWVTQDISVDLCCWFLSLFYMFVCFALVCLVYLGYRLVSRFACLFVYLSIYLCYCFPPLVSVLSFCLSATIGHGRFLDLRFYLRGLCRRGVQIQPSLVQKESGSQRRSGWFRLVLFFILVIEARTYRGTRSWPGPGRPVRGGVPYWHHPERRSPIHWEGSL